MKWVRRGFWALISLALLAVGILYGGTEMQFRRRIAAPLPRIQAATNPLEIEEGARLAKIEGCQLCHGAEGRGRVMYDDAMIGRIIAPALSRVAADASDGQLARAIRNGVGINARPLYVMPTEATNHLSDQDLARIIGWIRSLPETGFDIVGSKQVGPVGRLGVLIGRFPSSVNLDSGQPAARPRDIGRYFATVSCGECHAVDHDRQAGTGDLVAPALAQVAAAYDRDAFHTLLRTGKAAGGRELEMMSDAARSGFAAFSDVEVDAMQSWLKSQAAR